ncbi:hypothetical protein PHLCEN_2v7389 [Hermanssonia centrifuga]|uniref:Uncharacterized protein n=1 Tax=Hermanssonia centrifuga TaxID=98765 RepID=A0A2R6NWP9_9APHY|nr:hypothetical protein PHLCEN_2v7389 [Hermanssonia centrifuga]
MPSLETLHCTTVTWPAVPDTPPVVYRQRRIPSRLSNVLMDGGCTDNSAVARVLTGRRREVRNSTTAACPLLGLDPEQLHIISKLAFQNAEKINSSSILLKIDSVYRYDARFSFILPSTISPNSIVQVEIIVIIIPEYKDGDSDKWNKTCEQLLPLPKLILAFSSKEEMIRFVRDVVNTEMDELCSADRVKYVVLQGDPEDGMLLQAFVDSEELKVSHCDGSLQKLA